MFELDKIEKVAHDPTNKATDEWYLDYIKKYKNSEFYNELENNPYLIQNNKDYSPGFWNSIGESFGFTGGRDSYYEDLLRARNEKLSQIEAQIREQEHNDPENEVARRKAAGLNDDLSGGQAIGTGEAPQNDQPIESPAGMGTAEDTIGEGIGAIWDCFTNAYSLTMGFLGDIQNYKQAQNATEAGELSNFGAFMDLADKAVEFSMHNTGDNNWNPQFDKIFQPLFKNRKRYEKFKNAYGIASQSAKTYRKKFQMPKEGMESEMGYAETYGWWQEAMDEDFLETFSKETYRLEKEITKLHMKLDKEQTENKIKYERTKDYELEAEYENRANSSEINKADVERILNGYFARIGGQLERGTKKKGARGMFNKIMLSLMSLKHLNMLPNLNVGAVAGLIGKAF